jgi:transcriptional regulator GlxA family with amidase domain
MPSATSDDPSTGRSAAPPAVAPADQRHPVRIAICLFPDVEELDFAGPWEVLSYWAREVAPGNGVTAEVVTVADTAEPIRAAKGLRVLPDLTWDELGPINVLIVPGGRGTRAMLGDRDPMHGRLRQFADDGVLVTSVCTGALVLAAAGLLANRPATTHFSTLDLLSSLDPTLRIRPDDRYVDDGDVITAAGVSAGIDMALHLVVRLDGEAAARAVKREIQYDPQPPV